MEENKLVNEEVNLDSPNEEIQKKTILIVEDEDISYEILSTMLKDKYEILRAVNGEEGLRILRKEAKNISLVLLDILIPVMDGFAMLRTKVAERRITNIPVIVLTSEKSMEVEGVLSKCICCCFLLCFFGCVACGIVVP